MRKTLPLLTAGLIGLSCAPSAANDRYMERPPVVVSPDLSAPWVMQLGRKPGKVAQQRRTYLFQQQQRQPEQRRIIGWVMPDGTRVRALPPADADNGVRVLQPDAQAAAYPVTRQPMPQMDPMFLPRDVAYDGKEQPGTIVIDTKTKFLYLVEGEGRARRYGVGVGKEAFLWTGSQKITRKAEWPEWRPPSEMIAREKEKGRILPAFMDGGPANPLGARAMYLGDTLYRIHGTNAPWSIGTNVSSGCIRMRNEDVTDLYERVKVGTQVHVI